jgi:hypothetical protein
MKPPRSEVESSALEITDVFLRRGDPRLAGWHLEAPEQGQLSSTYAVKISGWVLGVDGPVEGVEVRGDQGLLVRAAVELDRPDIATAFPDLPASGVSGFTTTISTLTLASEFALELLAVMPEGFSIPLGTVRGRRSLLPAAPDSNIQPLIVTTFGRTGSSWLLRVLEHHPDLVAYRPFEYESRVVIYWATVLLALSRPASYTQILEATDISQPQWWLGNGVPAGPPGSADPRIESELGRRGIDELAEFVHRRVESFYRSVSHPADTSVPRFLVEKSLPGWPLIKLVEELYPAAKEVVLVRDFRDMICSILAFNEKRQTVGFGREAVESDDQYVVWIRDFAVEMLEYYRERRGKAYLLRYEDLIRQPEAALAKLLDWLGVASDPTTVRETLASASPETPTMIGHRTVRDASDSVGRWTRDLPLALRARSSELLGEALLGFGYEP